jgi:hypothetical protein
MVRIGENSANLHGMLKEVADVYDQRIQARIDTFVSLIEPVIRRGAAQEHPQVCQDEQGPEHRLHRPPGHSPSPY